MLQDRSVVWKKFKNILLKRFKSQRVECKHCGYQLISQAFKLKNHLCHCDSYTRSLMTRSQHHPTLGPIGNEAFQLKKKFLP